MNSNVMSSDQLIVKDNEGLHGTGKLTYSPLSLGLAGQETVYNVGNFEETSHTSVSYDLAETAKADRLAHAMKQTATELPQATAINSKFSYCQYGKNVELIVSNFSGVSTTNIETQLNNELWKEWDKFVFFGDGFTNEGYQNHSKSVVIPAGALTFDEFVAQTTVALANLAAVGDFTSDEYNRITMVHDYRITAVIRKFEAGAIISNQQKFNELFPGLVLVEAPQTIMAGTVGTGECLLVLRQLVSLHRASLPALYGRDSGKYGTSQDSLWTYESAGVELELDGAIQDIQFA